jgi:hypothetical protein
LFSGARVKIAGMRYLPLTLAPLLILTACSGEDRTAGGTTAGEARALEDAAEMLDDRRLPAGSVPSGAAAAPASPAAAPATATAPAPSPAAKPSG